MVATEILIIAVIIVLLGYIIFLHIQLIRKNLFIESTIKRLSGIEKTWGTEETMRFLQEIKLAGEYSSFFTDRLFDEKPMRFLLENEKDSRIFMHYTKNEIDARSILKEGFMFADSFYKTALPVTKDKLDLLIKHNGRKSFGDYLIVISFDGNIFNYYSDLLKKNGFRDYSVENVLTETPPYLNENTDMVYLLSNRFIKGYINHQTGDITRNPEFNPSYNSPVFEKNLELLRSR